MTTTLAIENVEIGVGDKDQSVPAKSTKYVVFTASLPLGKILLQIFFFFFFSGLWH